MNYSETLKYLYSQLPMFQRVGAQAFKKDLTNTLKLCAALDNPQRKFPAVHVAGTNGKGSVSHSLAAIFQYCGYKTGIYTSPHLVDFRERIRINGQMMPEQAVVDFVARIQPVAEAVKPSFFEMTVAMAFDYFARQEVDIAIIETGMGGNFDSTNVITPVLSIITNISLDHQQFLGNTLAEIAWEKAGIIKEKIPVVIGITQEETAPIFQVKALTMLAPIYFADKVYELETVQNDLHQHILSVKENGNFREKLKTDLTGQYQTENLATVLMAVDILNRQGFKLHEAGVEQGLLHVKDSTGLRGRMDIIHEKPLTICDVAHNIAGLTKLLEQVRGIQFRKLHFVLGMVADKDVEGVLNILPKAASYYFCKPDLPRGLDVQGLLEKATYAGLTGTAFPSVAKAYLQAMADADAGDFVLIAGSAFVVAEVLKEAEGLI